MFLGHNLATDTLGLGSPLPAHKFLFLEGIVMRREAEMAPCRANWPIHSSSTLHNAFRGPTAVPLLSACSLCPPALCPQKEQEMETHSVAIAGVQSSPHVSLCPGDTQWAVFIQKKQTSFLVAL